MPLASWRGFSFDVASVGPAGGLVIKVEGDTCWAAFGVVTSTLIDRGEV